MKFSPHVRLWWVWRGESERKRRSENKKKGYRGIKMRQVTASAEFTECHVAKRSNFNKDGCKRGSRRRKRGEWWCCCCSWSTQTLEIKKKTEKKDLHLTLVDTCIFLQDVFDLETPVIWVIQVDTSKSLIRCVCVSTGLQLNTNNQSSFSFSLSLLRVRRWVACTHR